MYLRNEVNFDGGSQICRWTANRGVASHARADSIDAVAGRGGEAHGRRRGASAGAHHERMRDERAREAAAGDAELPPESLIAPLQLPCHGRVVGCCSRLAGGAV